jgi:nitrogen-specific signal transduction histidine kinase
MTDKPKTPNLDKLVEENQTFHQVIHELVDRVRKLTEENEALKIKLAKSED